MPKDSPGYDRDAKERGLHAKDGTDPTLAGYLSSLVLALTVPGALLVGYGGLFLGYYDWNLLIPVVGAVLVTVISVTVLVMWLQSR